MDFPHQQLMSPFLLPTPRIIDRPPGSLSSNIEHIASWSEAESREGSSPCQKEEMEAVEKSSTNFCAIVVPQQQYNPPQGNEPDLSGALLLSIATLPPLFSMPLLPIFSALLFLPLCGLDAQGVSFLPAGKAGFLLGHWFTLRRMTLKLMSRSGS